MVDRTGRRKNPLKTEPQNEVAMSGPSRPNFSKFVSLIALSAATMVIAQPAYAQGAPIKYKGQGTTTAYTSIVSNNSARASTRHSTTNYTAPNYAQPVESASVQTNPRTKRIEFRYPDQPSVIHSSDGSTSKTTTERPIKYSSRKAAESVQEATKYAAIGQPTKITSRTSSSPILHQPNYSSAVIEEVAMGDIDKPADISKTNSGPGGALFQPVAQPGYDESGLASWYGDEFHGQPTANGEIFDMELLTAAHPTLPLPSLVQVTNLDNGREVVVRVNDRGRFVPNRLIDVSRRAADELGFLALGETRVQLRYLGPAPITVQASTGQGSAVIASATAVESEPSNYRPQRVSNLTNLKMDPIPNPVGSDFFIQAGSFSEMANAERLSRQLGGTLPVDVVLANVNGSDFFRVLIGPYSNRADAASMRDQLDADGVVDGVLIKGAK